MWKILKKKYVLNRKHLQGCLSFSPECYWNGTKIQGFQYLEKETHFEKETLEKGTYLHFENETHFEKDTPFEKKMCHNN